MANAIDSMGEYLGHGASGIVEKYREIVVKRPYPANESSLREIQIEARIYNHLGPHSRVVQFLSWDSAKSILEIEYMENGTLKDFLKSHDACMHLRLRWAQQAADVIEFLHSRGVIHCDVKPDNFLLDNRLDLKISDFAGSSLHGSDALVCASTRYLRPSSPGAPCSVQDDIFGLGSTIYTIMTGREPYGELKSTEVGTRFSSAEWPETRGIPFQDIIQSCWSGTTSIETICGSLTTSTREREDCACKKIPR